MVAPRKAAFAEESAEVEVLFANLEKLKGLTKKIQGSLNRLETSGKSVEEAIGPIYGNTQRLQVANNNIDRIIEAIDRIREPLDRRGNEERIIRAGVQKVGIHEYLASLDRTTQALSELSHSNLRSNQQAIADLKSLLKTGQQQLDEVFRNLLKEDARPVEPLHYITKQIAFPRIPQEKLSPLRSISSVVSAAAAQVSQGEGRETPNARAYAEVRGTYVATSLQNLAAASVSTARKTIPEALYRQGTNAIGTYATGIEGLFLAEFESICPIFKREEWPSVYNATCQLSLSELSKTIRELNNHVKNNLITDCYLAYEIIEIISNLSFRIDSKTGELKRQFSESLQPVRETAKSSLWKVLDDVRMRVQNLTTLPQDGSSVPITTDVMTRLQTMTAYITPLSSILTSLGDGGWSKALAASSSTSANSMKSFDVGADGRQLFAHYAVDMIEMLLTNLESKSRMMMKTRALQGIFLANNVAVINRMIRSSELQPLMASSASKIESWRKKGTASYLDAWKEPSAQLLDVQYTNRGARPPSGSGGPVDSAAVIKSLGSKDKDSIKEKFKNFNTSFDELIARHKSYKMEKEVRSQLAREVQGIIEPLYGRFWDRYHEVDKGKGKYVKYDKGQLGSILAGLG